MKRIVLLLVSASVFFGGCVSFTTSKVRRSLFILAMLSLTCFEFAHAEVAVDMSATQAEQQAFEEISFSLGIKNLTGENAVSNPESTIPKKYIQASANNSNSARLLGGLWTFVETMGSSTYTDTYTFTSVDASADSSGDYFVWGTNKYGYLVGGKYTSSVTSWIVADPISSTSGYTNAFSFTFTDDNHVSGCYYFTPKSGSLGTCYSFVGSRAAVAPPPTSQTISFLATPTVAVGGTGQLSASASSGLAVTFASATTNICTVSGTKVTGVAVGTCTITANQAGNSSYYAAPQASKNIAVTVSAPSASAPGIYDGIYQWDAGYYLSVHQIGGGTLIGTIYWVYTANAVQVGTRAISQADTFDLFQGQLVGSSATMTGARFYRGCTHSYDFTFNSDALTVRLSSVSNSPGVSVADIDCVARYNSIGSTWTIPKVY